MRTQIEYVYELNRYGIQPGLERISAVLEKLNTPDRDFPSVHIAGTNGKGSTAAFLESIVRTAGYRTGLYTSPHIHCYNERIRINGAHISDQQLEALIPEVRAAAQTAGVQLTFFEFGTAMAFLTFARAEVDLAVVEVGMGGLYDATNVLVPELAVITNIGLDHMQFLGNTRREIAARKAGIIKSGVDTVHHESDPRIVKVFERIARKHRAALFDAEAMSSSDIEGIRVPLPGSHQRDNARTAIAAVRRLRAKGWRISDGAVQDGIESTQWEGRLDVVSREPLIIADGAHNEDGLAALRAYVTSLPRRDVLVFGQKDGSSADPRELAAMFDTVIATEGNYRPADARALAAKLDARAEPNVAEAIERGRCLLDDARGGEHAPTMVIAGSLYMVADALCVLRES